MKCQMCGAELADNAQFCPNCQMPVGYQTAGQPLSKKEFYKQPGMKKCRSNIICSAVILYICAAVSIALNVVLLGNIFGLIDVILVVGLALGIHLGQSRACAIIIFIYAVYNMISIIVTSGRPGGYLIILAGIDAMIATFQFHRAWKNYQNTGTLPVA